MLSCMRTTIEISDELFRQLKRKAADEGATIRQVVESALRVYLGKQSKRKGYQLNWKTERGRILPGVRLDDRDALFDLMDGRL
jgi:Arc/MetJ family transcription regulator